MQKTPPFVLWREGEGKRKWKQRVEDERGVSCLNNSTAYKNLSWADLSQDSSFLLVWQVLHTQSHHQGWQCLKQRSEWSRMGTLTVHGMAHKGHSLPVDCGMACTACWHISQVWNLESQEERPKRRLLTRLLGIHTILLLMYEPNPGCIYRARQQ